MTILFLSLALLAAAVYLVNRSKDSNSKGTTGEAAGFNEDVPEPVEQVRLPTLEEAREELKCYAERFVAQGFDGPAEIVNRVKDLADDEYGHLADDLEIQTLVDTVISAHLLSEKEWPEETDCNRLDSAFQELNDSGIVARQNFSCCQNCGFAEIGDEIQEQEKSQTVRGFTFYHMQDTESAAFGYGLYLAYGSLSGEESETLAIAREIVAVLERNDFTPNWDGSLSQRIHVPITWQKRRE